MVAPTLDVITHYELHAIPVLSHKVASDQKTLGQRLLDASILAAYSTNQLPLTITRQVMTNVIQNFNNRFSLLPTPPILF
jgi:hypothetical protein